MENKHGRVGIVGENVGLGGTLVKSVARGDNVFVLFVSLKVILAY